MRITSKLATIALTSGLVVAGFAGTASAATTDPTPVTANVVVSPAITMTGLPSSFTLTGVPGATPTTTVNYTVETNNTLGYSVTVQAATSSMTGTAPNTDIIPVTSLMAKDSTGSTYFPLSTTQQSVHTQATRSGTSGDALTTDYEILIPNVKSDTYTATLNYVATTL